METMRQSVVEPVKKKKERSYKFNVVAPLFFYYSDDPCVNAKHQNIRKQQLCATCISRHHFLALCDRNFSIPEKE